VEILTVLVDFEKECFTWIPDTTYLNKSEDWKPKGKVYGYSERKASYQDWFNLDKGEGFDYVPPELVTLPDKDCTTVSGKNLRDSILKVFEGDGITMKIEGDDVTRYGKVRALPINESFTDSSSLEVVGY